MSMIKGFLNEAKSAKVIRLSFCLGLLTAFCLAAAPAHALFIRTWVSGAGDDASPTCSRTAPCLSFQSAHDKTSAGGEINCLDSSGFGALTITKAVAIVCEGVVAGVLAPGSSGIIVDAGASDVVILRGLDFGGAATGTGNSGVYFSNGGALHIENCRIHDFNAVGGWGIQFRPAAAAELYVTGTTISHNGSADGGGGILVKVAAGTTSKVTVNRSDVQNNTFGIKADGFFVAGGVINMTIRDTASVGNSLNGIVGTTPAGGAVIVMMLDRVASSHNAAGFGIIADGPNTFITFGASSIAGNANGVGTSNGGTLLSFGDNHIYGNSVDGTPATIALK